MDVKLYTGNGSTQSISGLGFSPDFVWIKSRSNTGSHALYDIIRGNNVRLRSDTTDGDQTLNSIQFQSTGFDLSTDLNTNAYTYAAWCWDAGSSTVTNTQGSISSQVRANASAGFSIVTYTGTGSSATVGHGLGVAPSLIMIKSRSNTWNWIVYHASVGSSKILNLNTTASVGLYAAFANTSPTSSVFSLTGGTDKSAVNVFGETHVAYCFAPVAGYASMGSFVANANSDGPFVYTSFKPRLVLCKLSSASGADWLIFDTARSPYNVVQANLRPNTSGAEESAFARIDILSNGFKVRAGSGVEPNGTNGNTYIYAAWAESPFNHSRAA
jgi:hypothetical protein